MPAGIQITTKDINITINSDSANDVQMLMEYIFTRHEHMMQFVDALSSEIVEEIVDEAGNPVDDDEYEEYDDEE